MKSIIAGVVTVALIITVMMTVGINDNGYRTVVQYPNGTTFVKFSPGWYVQMFGTATVYPDVITHDLGDQGVKVRYQDGGMGAVQGVVRVSLPTDEQSMLHLHRAIRDDQGLRNKIIYPEVKQALNLTAGLMTSEEAYAVKRNDYASWATEQIQKGRFKTCLEAKEVVIDDKTEIKQVPTIFCNGSTTPEHTASAIADYGMTVTGFQITDWDFEPATLKQIDTKRQAEMAVITAKAQADQAKWEEKQAEAEGEKAVTIAKYQELETKEREIVIAERKKEVAVIAAVQQKEVNQEQLEAAKIDVQTAKEQAQAVRERADAEAHAKKVVMEADGALAQKLATYEKVMAKFATEFGKQKWVPEIQMGGDGTGTGTAANDLIQMLNVQTAKQLSLDTNIK